VKKAKRIKKLLLLHKATPLVCVDAGAKGRLEIIDELSEVLEVHAFEPNPKEFQKLTSVYKKTSFHHLSLNQLGLSDRQGAATLFLTDNASMSSTLEADLDNYEKHFGKFREFKRWKKNMNVLHKELIKTETLDRYFINKHKNIDFLKIDTQGTELSILKGATNLLQQKLISIIKLEVTTIPVYKRQVLFSEIDIFLRHLGYGMVDFITYPESTGKVFGKIIPTHAGPCGDAIYMLENPHENKTIRLKKCLILMWLGYISLAETLMDTLDLDNREIKTLTNASQPTALQRTKKILKLLIPPLFLKLVKYFNKH
jgi:FkbM family methyltransferase